MEMVLGTDWVERLSLRLRQMKPPLQLLGVLVRGGAKGIPFQLSPKQPQETIILRFRDTSAAFDSLSRVV